MFFVNTIRFIDGEDTICDDQRCIGYFRHYAEAHDKIVRNSGDLFECGYYQYACICKLGQGLYRSLTEVQWFRYNRATGDITTIEKPEELRHFQQYIIG